MSTKLEVRLYKGTDLKLRFPIAPTGLSVLCTVDNNQQHIDSATKSSNIEWGQALYFTTNNLNGNMKVQVVDRNGAESTETYSLGSVEIPLSIVSSTPSGTEVVSFDLIIINLRSLFRLLHEVDVFISLLGYTIYF